MKPRGAALHLCAALMFSPAAHAQGDLAIAGTVAGPGGNPLPFSTVSIRENGAERFSNNSGEFVLGDLAAGSYHVRVKQLGFTAFDTLVAVLPELPPIHLRIVLSPVAFRLETVTIREKTGCVIPTESDVAGGSTVETVLEELRKNAERERLLTTSYPFEYRVIVSFDQHIAPLRRGPDTVAYRSDARDRYFPGGLVRPDQTRSPGTNWIVIPVLADLGDLNFLRSHCFEYRGKAKDAGLVTHRIDFRPTPDISGPDVEGSVFLDWDSFVIRRAVFRLTRPQLLDPPIRGLEMTSSYREILPGVTVIGEVRSVQIVTEWGLNSSGRSLSERQRLLDFRFLKGAPGDTLRRR